MTAPVLVMISGINGAGKSTITNRLRRSHGFPENYTNPDDIVLTLTNIPDPAERVYTAAKLSARQREEWLQQRQSMAFETVMSHPSKIEFLQLAKDSGYSVFLVFVGLSNPGLSIQRVRQRVLSGGHDVPTEKIIARYDRVMALLPRALQIADRAMVYDNSEDDQEATLIASFTNGQLNKGFDKIPEWFQACL
jgi:predicted ABC-type ATPase